MSTEATSAGATRAAPSRVVPCVSPRGETSQLPAWTGAPERGTTSRRQRTPADTPVTLTWTRTQPAGGTTTPVSDVPVRGSTPASARVPGGVVVTGAEGDPTAWGAGAVVRPNTVPPASAAPTRATTPAAT